MRQVQWLSINKKFFSTEMNGYSEPPLGPYISTLPLIDRDGKILDLGCGNGMLLQFLLEFSQHKLTPYGVDHTFKAVTQASTEILPEFKNNFEHGDVNNYNFRKGPFDIIIANPFYSNNKKEFTDKCLSNLYHDGRLIYRIHNDVLRDNNIKNLEELPEFQNRGMRVSQGDGLSFCVFEK